MSQDYRIYLLNGSDRIVAGLDAQCADDDDALRLAARAVGVHPAAEVWSGPRKVGRVGDPAASGPGPEEPFEACPCAPV